MKWAKLIPLAGLGYGLILLLTTPQVSCTKTNNHHTVINDTTLVHDSTVVNDTTVVRDTIYILKQRRAIK